MKLPLSVFLSVFVLYLVGAAEPYIGYLYPAGAEAGKSIQLLVGGQNLGGIRSGIVSGDGVTVRKVTAVPGFPTPDGTQRKYLKQWIRNIEANSPEKPPLPARTDAWRKNIWWEKLDRLDRMSLNLVIRDLYIKRNALQATPSIKQLLIVELEVSPNAQPGIRELRLWGRQGISAPKLFFVDTAPHIREPEFVPPEKPQPETPLVTAFPTILDGQIMPGETDRFRLKLEADKPYTMTLTGRKFQPFIGDAVPGHFQPVLRLLNPVGKEVAFADDDYFNPDPVLRFQASESGEYMLEVRDNLYRGREDFVYRVQIIPEWRPYQFGQEPFPALPRVKTGETINITKPQVISGTLNPRETANFTFSGRKGQKLVCEVAARRCGSPLDGVIRLIGPNGNWIAEADDSPSELNIGECLQQFDPYLALTLPADGTYTLKLWDRLEAGGKDYRYWLRLGPLCPDFQIYTSRSVLNIRPGETGKLKLYVVRSDGFDEKITLTAAGASMLKAEEIPPGTEELTVMLKNPFRKAEPPQTIQLYAEAVVNGLPVRKQVTACDEFIQAFAYTHLLPAKELLLGSPRSAPKRKMEKR